MQKHAVSLCKMIDIQISQMQVKNLEYVLIEYIIYIEELQRVKKKILFKKQEKMIFKFN